MLHYRQVDWWWKHLRKARYKRYTIDKLIDDIIDESTLEEARYKRYTIDKLIDGESTLEKQDINATL